MLFKLSKLQHNTQTYEIKDDIFPSGKYIEYKIIHQDNLSRSPKFVYPCGSFYTLASFPAEALYVQSFPILIKQKQ